MQIHKTDQKPTLFTVVAVFNDDGSIKSHCIVQQTGEFPISGDTAAIYNRAYPTRRIKHFPGLTFEQAHAKRFDVAKGFDPPEPTLRERGITK